MVLIVLPSFVIGLRIQDAKSLIEFKENISNGEIQVNFTKVSVGWHQPQTLKNK